MSKGYILVEGHGEQGAVDNLIIRLSKELHSPPPAWAPAIRWKNLHQQTGIEKGANFVRTKPDANALLVLRDEDDACPAKHGPRMAAWLRDLRLPFPAAVVLLHPEYEVLFLPCLEKMAGKPLGSGVAARPGLSAGTRWEGDWEARRGIKEWLSAHYPPNRSYKPTVDQLPLTRMIDFSDLRSANLHCFGTLERSMTFLAKAQPGEVYPKPAEL